MLEAARLRLHLADQERHGRWEVRAANAEATIDRVREVIACHSHDSAACDLLDDLDAAIERNEK